MSWGCLVSGRVWLKAASNGAWLSVSVSQAMYATALRLADLHMHRAVNVTPLALRPVTTREFFDETGPTPRGPRVLVRQQGLVERAHGGTIWVERRVVGESRHICVNGGMTLRLRAETAACRL